MRGRFVLKPHLQLRGGECMEILLSLLIHAAVAFVKVFAKTLAYYIIKRVKDRADLISSKDDSDINT